MERRVRPAQRTDAEAVRSIYAPAVERTPISFEVDPPSADEVADRIEGRTEEYPWLVCEADGRVVGYAAANQLRSMPPYQWAVELSIYVAEDARDSGVGTALYDTLLSVLELQGYYDAYAAMTVPNPASRALHERMGFESIGVFPAAGYKLGEWHDVRWWHKQLADRPAEPDPPTPFPELLDDPRLDGSGDLDS